MEKTKPPIYQRILLKLSGESLQGTHTGIDPREVTQLCTEIATIARLGTELGVVIGGGNLIRGADLPSGFDRVTADQMGMLATVINGLALRDALQQQGLNVRIMSAIPIQGLVDFYNRNDAKKALQQKTVVIFVGGTGNPLVTTDSAAALRGIEMGADILLKATKVDGVFSADPRKDPTAKRYHTLTYSEVLEQRLGVMDLNAILLCQDHGLALRVFNMNQQGALQSIVCGDNIGTLIRSGV